MKILNSLWNLKTARLVITLRSERGYSATNYDHSVAGTPKTLRRQIGRFYDVKKVRNNLCRGMTGLVGRMTVP